MSEKVKLIVTLSKGQYENLKDIQFGSILSRMIFNAVQSGIPLPKGHGRLIDADKLEYTCNSDECGMLMGCNHCQYHVITEDEIDNAPTITEADKENKDE